MVVVNYDSNTSNSRKSYERDAPHFTQAPRKYIIFNKTYLYMNLPSKQICKFYQKSITNTAVKDMGIQSRALKEYI